MPSRMLVVLLYFLTTTVIADESESRNNEPLGGIYLDKFTGLSIKGGYAHLFTSDSGSNQPLIYFDAEAGTKALKITAGTGLIISCCMNARVGISYAYKDSSEYFGVEGVTSITLLSFKVGIYQNKTTNETHYGVGVGFGF